MEKPSASQVLIQPNPVYAAVCYVHGASTLHYEILKNSWNIFARETSLSTKAERFWTAQKSTDFVSQGPMIFSSNLPSLRQVDPELQRMCEKALPHLVPWLQMFFFCEFGTYPLVNPWVCTSTNFCLSNEKSSNCRN